LDCFQGKEITRHPCIPSRSLHQREDSKKKGKAYRVFRINLKGFRLLIIPPLPQHPAGQAEEKKDTLEMGLSLEGRKCGCGGRKEKVVRVKVIID